MKNIIKAVIAVPVALAAALTFASPASAGTVRNLPCKTIIHDGMSFRACVSYDDIGSAGTLIRANITKLSGTNVYTDFTVADRCYGDRYRQIQLPSSTYTSVTLGGPNSLIGGNCHNVLFGVSRGGSSYDSFVTINLP